MIKKYEQIISLGNITESISLLNTKIIEKLSQEYNYIYIRLVQVTIKPLIRENLTTLLLLCLRDKRRTHSVCVCDVMTYTNKYGLKNRLINK